MTVLKRFEAYYETFHGSNFDDLGSIYATDVVFRDPVLQVRGVKDLKRYFKHSSQGLNSCTFEFGARTVATDAAHYQWVMKFSHAKLKSGKSLSVRGCTALQFGELINYHEDYYDLGALLYENVPVLGGVIGMIKNRMHGGERS